MCVFSSTERMAYLRATIVTQHRKYGSRRAHQINANTSPTLIEIRIKSVGAANGHQSDSKDLNPQHSHASAPQVGRFNAGIGLGEAHSFATRNNDRRATLPKGSRGQ